VKIAVNLGGSTTSKVHTAGHEYSRIIKTYLNQLVFLNAVREKEGAYQLKDEAIHVAHDMDRLLQRDAAVLKALSERPDPSPVP
jgi:hypothetical protein